MRMSTCLLPKVLFFAVFALALCVGRSPSAVAQGSGEVVPASYQSGAFFNRQLGTALRFNYNTRGYGTQDDVFSLGGMKIFNMDGATVFLDGQGTLSDDFGGGFNLGVGYRQLTTTGMSFDPQRVLGAGFWTDGQSSSSDNFFTQLGFSLESLGESFDLRLNGYFPLDRTQTSDPILTEFGAPNFQGNNLFNATELLTVDTAHSVVDGEFAKRINDLEAWAYLGGYQIGGGGVDATGYRAGVRGYAVPDLLLSLQVTDDDVYATNVMFGVTWFIGRTNKCNGPCGTILDRMREPVSRNNFIAMTNRSFTRAAGDALTIDGTNLVDIVHVDSSAGPGGDGTFENPFDQLQDINATGATMDNTRDGSIVLVHSGSTLDGSAALRNNVRLLGEGTDQDGNTVNHFVQTSQNGMSVNVLLPETAVGAQAENRPEIDGSGVAGSVVTLADGSAIDNFTINNAQTAILANGITVPTGDTIANVEINNPTVVGISLTNVMGAAVINNNVIIDGASGMGLLVDGGNESVSMFGAINNTTGNSVVVRGRTGGTVTYAGTINDNLDVATNSMGVLIENNAGAMIDFNNASVLDINVAGTDVGFTVNNNTDTDVTATGIANITAGVDAQAVRFENNDLDSSLMFSDLNATAFNGDTVNVSGEGTVNIGSADDTRMIANNGTGNAVVATGNATLNVSSNIDNSVGGRAVNASGRSDNIATFSGTINDTGEGLLVNANTGGSNVFIGMVTTNTGVNRGVTVTNTNTDATTSFGGGLDITTTSGTGFFADGAGTLIATSSAANPNTVSTGTGTGVDISNTSIDDTAGVTFDSVNVASAAGNGINLDTLDGAGQVVIGNATGAAASGGVIESIGTAVRVNNAANVAINNVQVNNNAGSEGVAVTNQATGSVATFTGLEVNTGANTAVRIGDDAGLPDDSNDDGMITFSNLTATTSGAGDGIVIDNNDASTAAITINDATVNATGAGRGVAATGGGTIVMGGTNVVNTATGTAFEVDDVEDLTASNVTIDNTTAQGVSVTGQNTNTDSVTLTNFDVTTTTADAVTVSGNTNGTVDINNLTAESSTGDTVVLDNNTGATVNINGMTATATGSGTAFSATNGGTLSATGTNNLSASTGRGLNVENMTIAAGGAAFTSVNVTAGATTGINLNTLTGGTVTVNGGTVDTVGAVVAANVTNVENAVFNNVTANSAGDNAVNVSHTAATDSDVTFSNLTVASGLQGMNVSANGAGEFDLTVTGANITGVTGEGIAYDTGAAADRVDFTLTNSTITVGDQNGFLATLNDSNTADVRFVINNNDISNASAADSALDISVGSGLTAHLRVGDLFAGEDPPAGTIGDNNVFTNSTAGGDPLRISINDGGAGGTLNLDLRDNTAQSGTVQFQLTQTSGTFNLVDAVDTLDPNNENNVGDVIDNGVINTFAPPILAPTP